MALEFTKLHGLGNDFIFFDDRTDELTFDEATVRALCDRHKGIGADGVILVKPSPNPECAAFMHYINSDGTLAAMCGNGVRCFAKYLVDRDEDHQLTDGENHRLIVDTPAGMRPITFETVDGKLVNATVAMGSPILSPKAIPVNTSCDSTSADGLDYVGHLELESPWGPFSFTMVSMGNPHAVCFIDRWDELPAQLFSGAPSLDNFLLEGPGAFFESHPIFPEKTNVEFVTVTPKGLAMRVFERGCGETLACGTGACATSVAATLRSLAGRKNDVLLKGGVLTIEWRDDGVYMTGEAKESFTGTVLIETLTS